VMTDSFICLKSEVSLQASGSMARDTVKEQGYKGHPFYALSEDN